MDTATPMDPSSQFAVSVAVGAAHIVATVLNSPLARATRSTVAAAPLALPVLAAYLAFAVRATTDCYARIVVACGVDAAAAVAQKAALTVLRWVAVLVVRITVPPALLFGGLAIACALLSRQLRLN